jgi:UDP-N-acetylglucosamine 4-epimerase
MPRWISTLLEGGTCQINGDGETSRDFCYIANVMQANLLAGTVEDGEAIDQIYNVSFGGRTTLKSLYEMIRERLAKHDASIANREPISAPFRDGDVRHSQADTSKIRRLLGYEPTHSVSQGLDEAVDWYAGQRV